MDIDDVLETAFPEGDYETASVIKEDGNREPINWCAEDVPPKPNDAELPEDHQWSLWPDGQGNLVWVPVPRDQEDMADV